MKALGRNLIIEKLEDIIFYDKHAGHKIQNNKKIYHVIKSTDVVVVL
mgnify:CR=1 FL=1